MNINVTFKKMLESKIELIIKKDIITKRYFLGAIAFDELPIIESYPTSFIINTKPRSNEGEHWLALYFNEKKELWVKKGIITD